MEDLMKTIRGKVERFNVDRIKPEDSREDPGPAFSVPSCLRGETATLPGWHIHRPSGR